MKLAKVLLSNGERHIAIVEENGVQLLDLSQVDQLSSLIRYFVCSRSDRTGKVSDRLPNCLRFP